MSDETENVQADLPGIPVAETAEVAEEPRAKAQRLIREALRAMDRCSTFLDNRDIASASFCARQIEGLLKALKDLIG